MFEEIHADNNIDYMTMHIWPKNWGWVDVDNIPGTVESAIAKTNDYMNTHIEVAKKLKKPIVFEEFGLPRDHHGFKLSDQTTARDRYYANAFDQVYQHSKYGGVLGGSNFWAFGGTARPGDRTFWKNGDPVMGDPPQEQQGLNSVFDTDSTIEVIKKYNLLISKQLIKRK